MTDLARRQADAWIDRELSWLDFTDRVLELARDHDRPALERTKFLAIASNNLDEFFQVRVAALQDQLEAGVTSAGPDGLAPAAQLVAIRTRTLELTERCTETFSEIVRPALEKGRVVITDVDDLSDEDRADLHEVFFREVFPVLTPLAIDPAHPFPFVSSLSLNLAVVIKGEGRRQMLARVKVPPLLPRFLPLADSERFVPIEQVIALQLPELFPGMTIAGYHAFRVTRSAELEIEEDEADDLLEAIELGLRQRRRTAYAVRLEIDTSMPSHVRELLTRELELDESDVYTATGLLALGDLFALYDLDRPELKDPPWTPVTQRRLAPTSPETAVNIFTALRAGDILVHHPYDAFTTSVEAFIDQAAGDPGVMAIKWTLYRTSGLESPIIKALVRAAESGKQVVALVELKARFDEAANIERAKVLEKAGVHVVYGVAGLKTHAKISLVVRREDDAIRRYAHVGTGNYNRLTATQYEDVGLLTADPAIAADVADLFNYLTGYSQQRAFRRLLVAPIDLRGRLEELIAGQARPGGRIVLKANALADTGLVRVLYGAAAAGAEIDLIIRSICTLRPGVPELSERIRVRSLVGRYLEHSRILRFGEGDTATFWIGSADPRTRNLDHRVEAMVPVLDPPLRTRLDQILELELADDTLAWELGPDATWTRVPTEAGINAHDALQEAALGRGTC